MIALPLLSTVIVCFIYVFHFGCRLAPHSDTFNSYEAFGQFGDYFGGVLNPLLAFLNIALIVYYQATSFAKSAEKDTLFRMMEIQRHIVESIELKDHSCDKSESGLRAFWTFDNEIANKIRRSLQVAPNVPISIQTLVSTYELFYDDDNRKQFLGHYFRTLYHIFKMIDQSDCLSEAEKLEFGKLVRAQMSHFEQKLLFLNCVTRVGTKFRRYVSKYDLLEWISDIDFKNYDDSFLTSTMIRNEIHR